MSGWDGSRPTWDPERHESSGVPQHAAGSPPEIFGQDYGPQAPARHGQTGQGRGESAPRDQAPPDRAGPGGYEGGYGGGWNGGYDRDDNGYGDSGFGENGGTGTRGRHGAAQAAPRQEHGQPRHGQPDSPPPGYYEGRDPVGHDGLDPGYAARMDPALRDFFQPLRPTGPNRPGARRQPGQAPQSPYPPWAQPGQAPPGGQPPPVGPAERWDTGTGPRPGMGTGPRPGMGTGPRPGMGTGPRPGMGTGPRPGPRPGRRQDRRPPSRGGAKVAAAVAVVVVIGIAAAVFVLLRHHNTPTASNTPPPAQQTGQAKQSSSPTANAAQQAGYTLTAPATAGGYQKLATAPASVSNVATATAQGVLQHAVSTGAKSTGQVSGYYQLSGGQVMSFAGYKGTFDPAKVMADSGAKSYPAGPHGGMLACTPSAGSPGGTACVWVTPTTLGVTEFFSSTGAPEVVTDQAKAAEDTVNLRGDVEAAKS